MTRPITNVIRCASVVAMIIAGATVNAQARNDGTDRASARAWDENVRGNRIIEHGSRSPRDAYDAYDVYDGQPYVGSDWGVEIRSNVPNDRELRQ
jgi:hypothetical protein